MPFKMRIPAALVKPGNQGGDQDVFDRFNALIGGVSRFRRGNEVVIDDAVDQSRMSPAHVVALHNKGITIDGYGVTCQLNIVAANTEIPAGVPGRMTTDGQGNPVVRKFKDLPGGFTLDKDADGNPLRRLYLHDWMFNKQTGLTSAEIVILAGVLGLTVLSQNHEFAAIQEANNPDGP